MSGGRVVPVLTLVMSVTAAAQVGPPPTAPERREMQVAPKDIDVAIGNLGALDFTIRMNAARTIRRVPATQAVPALTRAATSHSDGFVRYRALILLSGFGDPVAKGLMTRAVTDPNDRLREVAYKFFEYNPDPSMVPTLLQAQQREESEFVRPALIRALAALGSDPKVRDSLLADVDRGVDFFRSVVIEALGDYKAQYAVPALMRVARLDGPLQDDAVLALGKTGDKRALEVFSSLQRTAPRNVQPSVAAAICLLGVNCASHQRYLDETLRFAATNLGFQELVRSAANGLAALTVLGNAQALGTLLEVGIPARDPERAPIALAIGTVALRSPMLLLSGLEKRADAADAILLLREAFDMLEEDFEEERFFVRMRRAYWEAPEGSSTRLTAEKLIQTLEF
jgi:HEAT repeat protein